MSLAVISAVILASVGTAVSFATVDEITKSQANCPNQNYDGAVSVLFARAAADTSATWAHERVYCFDTCKASACPKVDDVLKAMAVPAKATSCNGFCCPYGFKLDSTCSTTAKCVRDSDSSVVYAPTGGDGTPDVSCNNAEVKVAVTVTCPACSAAVSRRRTRSGAALEDDSVYGGASSRSQLDREADTLQSVNNTIVIIARAATDAPLTTLETQINLGAAAVPKISTLSKKVQLAPGILTLPTRSNFPFSSAPVLGATFTVQGQSAGVSGGAPPDVSLAGLGKPFVLTFTGAGFDTRPGKDQYMLVPKNVACSGSALTLLAAGKQDVSSSAPSDSATSFQVTLTFPFPIEAKVCYQSYLKCAALNSCSAGTRGRLADTAEAEVSTHSVTIADSHNRDAYAQQTNSTYTYSDTLSEGWYDFGGAVSTAGTSTVPTASTATKATHCFYFRVEWMSTADTSVLPPGPLADSGCATDSSTFINCLAVYLGFTFTNPHNYISVRKSGSRTVNGAAVHETEFEFWSPTANDDVRCATWKAQTVSRIPTTASNRLAALNIQTVSFFTLETSAPTTLTLTGLSASQSEADIVASVRAGVLSQLGGSSSGLTSDDIVVSVNRGADGTATVSISVLSAQPETVAVPQSGGGTLPPPPTAPQPTLTSTFIQQTLQAPAFGQTVATSTGGTVNCANGGAGCGSGNAPPESKLEGWVIPLVVILGVILVILVIALIVFACCMSRSSEPTAVAADDFEEEDDGAAPKAEPVTPYKEVASTAPASTALPAETPDDDLDDWPPLVRVEF